LYKRTLPHFGSIRSIQKKLLNRQASDGRKV
jgi:hypothetical protein